MKNRYVSKMNVFLSIVIMFTALLLGNNENVLTEPNPFMNMTEYTFSTDTMMISAGLVATAVLVPQYTLMTMVYQTITVHFYSTAMYWIHNQKGEVATVVMETQGERFSNALIFGTIFALLHLVAVGAGITRINDPKWER